MDVFEEMWLELRQRIEQANYWSVNKTLTYQDMLNLLSSYESHFEQAINEYRASEAQQAIKTKKDKEKD